MSVMPPAAASAAAAADGDDDEDDDVAIESVREVVAKQNSKVRRQREMGGPTVVLSDPENVGFFTVQIPDCRFYVHCTYIYNTLGSTTVK